MSEFKDFPQISVLISDKRLENTPLYLRSHFAKAVVADFKERLKKGENLKIDKEILVSEIAAKCDEFTLLDYKKLINATGVVVHTNLGRAPLGEAVFDEAKALCCGYLSLEFDRKSGKRGDRYGSVLEKLRLLFGCEDALIVNNNAAAVFLVLNTLANGGEVITSRGELVEIGGNFRVPEVMRAAGAKLVEIGTTNKTHLADYENAVSEATALLLKTHKSNFSMKGFCAEADLAELYALARSRKVPLYYDLGSGWVERLNAKLVKNEPSIKELASKCDILSFSADKLFGSAQAGVILGRKDLIEKLKKNQILRMLRVGKITLTVLNSTLKAYLGKKFDEIPTLKLLNESPQSVKNKALAAQKLIKCKTTLKESKSLVGGGSLPDKSLQSFILAFEGEAMVLQERFRGLGIVGRVEDEKFVLDFRSVLDSEISALCEVINEAGI